MNGHYYNYKKAVSFMRFSRLIPGRKTLLFLHGLGDSSLSYIPFLEASELSQYNILVPDLLGYGKSSENANYFFHTQCGAIIAHIEFLQNYFCSFEDIILIPHSMGSVHAMLLCQSTLSEKIKGVVNIEGTLTQYDAFISATVAKEYKKANFISWFTEFKQSILHNYIQQFPACHSYYASLELCQARAFLQNSLEMRKIALAGKDQNSNIIGVSFSHLPLPKIYCYGDKSLCQQAIDYLHTQNIPCKIFSSHCHFVMLDCFKDFLKFLTEWISSLQA